MGFPSLPSFWLDRPPSAARAEEVDVAVIGGGIVGLSTAYWLGKAGRPAVLLEAGSLAGRASGRNAGFLSTGSAEPYTALAASAGERAARRFWETSRENRELLRAEVLDTGGVGRVDCEFVPEGSWIAALPDTGQEEALRESAERLIALGFDLVWRDAAEVRRASGSARLAGGLYQPRDGGLDPVRLCRGLARLSGADVRTGFPVRAIEPEGERVRLVSDAGQLLARQVILALNAYVSELVPGLAAEIRPVRAQMLATAPGPRLLQGVWYVNDGYEYLRQLPDGTLLLGGCRWVAREVEVGTLETPTGTVQGALERFLAESFPRLADRPIRHRWAGIMALTPSGLPAIGTVPEIPAALYAAGMNGHGMSLGFATGRYLARRVCGEDPAPLFA